MVNLDPANYSLPYPVSIDLKELIDMEEVMDTFQLGPNGGRQQHTHTHTHTQQREARPHKREERRARRSQHWNVERNASSSTLGLCVCACRLGLMYCIEYLEKNLAWLKQRIKEQQKLHPSQTALQTTAQRSQQTQQSSAIIVAL